MLVIVYKFTPKIGQEAKFIESWKKVTEGIHKYRGSLGSRLHKDNTGNLIAYAQWPSREISERKVDTPEAHKTWLKTMMETLEKTEVLFNLNVVEDLLVHSPS